MVYAGQEFFGIRMNTFVFNQQGVADKLILTGVTGKFKDSYYSNIKGKEFIISDGVQIVVDESSKVMICQKVAMSDSLGTQMLSVDAAIERYDSVRFKGVNNEIKKYVIYNSKSQYPVIEVLINANNFTLKEMILHLPDGSSSSIDYGTSKLRVTYVNEKLEKSLFQIRHFVQGSYGAYLPSKNYQGFQILYR